MDKPRVLIVDDEQDVLNLCATQLAADYDVVTAKSGAQGIMLYDEESAAGRRFALVVLDVHMPGVNGLEVANHIHHRCRDVATRIIFLTNDLSVTTPANLPFVLGAFRKLEIVTGANALRNRVRGNADEPGLSEAYSSRRGTDEEQF